MKPTLVELEANLKSGKKSDKEIKMLLGYMEAKLLPGATLTITKETVTLGTDSYEIVKVEIVKELTRFELKGSGREFTLNCERKNKQLYTNSKKVDDFVGLVWTKGQ